MFYGRLDEGVEQRVAVPGRGLELGVELHAHEPGVHALRQLDDFRELLALGERGDPRQSIGQVLRYLDAIAPGATLLSLLQESDPSLVALQSAEATRRVRVMTPRQLGELDF